MDLINRLLAHVDLSKDENHQKEDIKILDPCAGNGALGALLRDYGVEVDCFELNAQNSQYLMYHGFIVKGRNFITQEPIPEYDYVIAIPPTANNVDCGFITRMLGWLKPGGKIISFTIPYWTNGIFGNQVEFRRWLNTQNWTLEFIEDGSNTPKAIIIIHKWEL